MLKTLPFFEPCDARGKIAASLVLWIGDGNDVDLRQDFREKDLEMLRELLERVVAPLEQLDRRISRALPARLP